MLAEVGKNIAGGRLVTDNGDQVAEDLGAVSLERLGRRLGEMAGLEVLPDPGLQGWAILAHDENIHPLVGALPGVRGGTQNAPTARAAFTRPLPKIASLPGSPRSSAVVLSTL